MIIRRSQLNELKEFKFRDVKIEENITGRMEC